MWVSVPNDGSILPIPNVANYPDGVSGFYDPVSERTFPDEENGFGGIIIALGVKPLAANAVLTIRGFIQTPGDFFPTQEKNLKPESGAINTPVFFSAFPVTPNLLANGVRFEVSCNTDCELFLGSITYVKVSQK